MNVRARLRGRSRVRRHSRVYDESMLLHEKNRQLQVLQLPACFLNPPFSPLSSAGRTRFRASLRFCRKNPECLVFKHPSPSLIWFAISESRCPYRSKNRFQSARELARPPEPFADFPDSPPNQPSRQRFFHLLPANKKSAAALPAGEAVAHALRPINRFRFTDSVSCLEHFASCETHPSILSFNCKD